ncbi:MAG: DASS family sodium-coupled anion symporter [Mariprofundaceae bacterium]|nr:DASS family sodium-coupled anion symporter [Mariprofundaceae bacterium]
MSLVIDHRPLYQLLFQRGLPFFAMIFLFFLFYWGLDCVPPEGMSEAAWRSLLIFMLCLLLWVSQLLPLAVTSLMGMALLPLLGVLPAADVYSMFGNPAVFFILGSFMLAAGVLQTGLSEHLALALLHRLGTSPHRLLMAMLFLPAFMAAFMPEHAVAAVFLPIALEIVRGLELKMGHRYAQSIFLAVAWGSIIGGVTTLLGGARGPLALGLITELTGKGFSFLDWTLAALPLVLVVLTVAASLLWFFTSFEGLDMSKARKKIEHRQLELGALSVKARIMGVLLLVTIGFWIFEGHDLGLASIALLSVVAMFSLRLVTWKAIESHVNWGVIFMYGGAIAVGKALAVTGAAHWIATYLLPQQMTALLLFALLAALTLLLTEGVSNAAAVAILLPVAVPVGMEIGVDPIQIALAIGIISGFAFMLPMGTPANALVFSTGYVRMSAMIGRGAVLSSCTWLCFMLMIMFWWPLLV